MTLIPASQFKPMLAKDADLAKVGFPLHVQIKLDGIRASVVDGKLVSRKLKLIPNQEIQAALARPEFEGLDGELTVGSPTAPGCMQTTSSFVMSSSKTGADWCYYVFDKWNEDAGFEVRYSRAGAVVREAFRASGDLAMVPFVTAGSEDELAKIEEGHVAEGHEGVIARVPDSAYKFGRSGVKGPLIKVKRFVDFEARVIGTYEEMHNANEAKRDAFGRTERSSHKAGKVGKDTLGGLICVALNGEYEGAEFRCGTGFTRAQRSELWKQRDELVGLYACVKYFPIGSKDRPRHPVWKGWRNMEIDG